MADSGDSVKGSDNECVLDPTRYTSPDEVYSLLVGALSVILEVHGDAGVLDEIGVKVLADIDVALRDPVTRRRVDLARRLYDIPGLIGEPRRKVLAAYYTDTIGVRVISAIARTYLLELGLEDVVVADPFMGSGVLLAGFIKDFGCEKIGRIIGFEKDPLACLVAYATLLRLCGKGKVEVRCGDTFKIASPHLAHLSTGYRSVVHIIITNPPFTRWELLGSDYREFLESVFEKTRYSSYIGRRQLNLQALAMFLADYMLREEGLLASVLPASTFYTVYGEGVKRFLRENYRVLALIQKRGESSFSVGSGFKEVILVASKTQDVRGETAFITLDDAVELGGLGYTACSVRALRAQYVDLHSVPPVLDFNWLSLFEAEALKPLVELLHRLVSVRKLITFADALGEKSIIRGVEMYGPDFFLIPNRFWRIAGVVSGSVAITNGIETLELPSEILVRALRRPGLYVDKILVEPDHYLVSIPPRSLEELPGDVRRYVKWGFSSGVATAAVRVFGERWYSHVYRQLVAKKPYATLFLPDKVDARFRNRGVFAVATEVPVSATKNFYLVLDKQCSPLLTLWFNSGFFISLLLYAGRAISEAWTRFLEEDYLKLPIPNPTICREYEGEAENIIREISSTWLPPLSLQIGNPYRRKLDEFIFDVLEAKGANVDYIHELLSKTLEELKTHKRRATYSETS